MNYPNSLAFSSESFLTTPGRIRIKSEKMITPHEGQLMHIDFRVAQDIVKISPQYQLGLPRSFAVHKGLLARCSGYFARHFREMVEPSPDSEVHYSAMELPCALGNMDQFGVLVTWLYKNSLKDFLLKPLELADIWSFGANLEVPKFQNSVMEKLLDVFHWGSPPSLDEFMDFWSWCQSPRDDDILRELVQNLKDGMDVLAEGMLAMQVQNVAYNRSRGPMRQHHPDLFVAEERI
ncbi:hypothetical protein B0J14DRAFT_559340 [Halenospora varia]|nr:hypothetical protein B0J14DRAFT_559340 [Halenospora varia]